MILQLELHILWAEIQLSVTEKKQTLDPSINETFAGRWSFFRKLAAARAWCHVKTSVFSLWYSSKKLVAALVGILAGGWKW